MMCCSDVPGIRGEPRGCSFIRRRNRRSSELFEEKNVILNTPTGRANRWSRRRCISSPRAGQRSIYTCPIKALVNEKWMALCRDFGPENVGSQHRRRLGQPRRADPLLHRGNPGQHRVARRPPAPVQEVIMDEFHYYADRERGVAWQVPLLTLPQARFLLMSATLGDTAFFEEELTRLNGRPTVTVASTDRPVPLEHAYSEMPLAKTLESLAAEGKAPVYVVHFTQLEAGAERAGFHQHQRLHPGGEEGDRATRSEGFKFTSPYGPDIKKWLRHGIGLHHAGLLPKYRVLVEQLAQKGLAQGHLRHGHARRRHQRADPHRALHAAVQVRRAKDGDPQRAGFSSDRRTRRTQRIR